MSYTATRVLPWLTLIVLAGFLQKSLQAGEENINLPYKLWVFPHVFNFGPGNATEITVNNPDDQIADLTVTCIDQDGNSTVLVFSEPFQAQSQAIIRLPEGFRGSCIVEGSVTTNATWNISVNNNNFAVGVPPLMEEQKAGWWDFPVGRLGAGSRLGLAVHNRSDQIANCRLRVFKKFKDAEASGGSSLFEFIGFVDGEITNFEFMVAANGQISRFFGDAIEDGEEFLSAILHCDQAVLSVVVGQNQANGFPTPISGTPIR